MKGRDIVTGLVVVLIIIGGALLIKKNRANKLQSIATPIPSIEEKITNKFGGITIPDDAEKADLNDVSGGNALGIATREYKDNKYTLTVLADLQAPESGYYYQAWIAKNEGTNLAYVNAGELRVAKGGYLVDFTSNKDFTEFKKVIVTLEKKSDLTPEKPILEGSF